MIRVGDRVQKLGVASEYTTGRQGVVLELDDFEEKAKVLWDQSENTGRKTGATWVMISSYRGLKKV